MQYQFLRFPNGKSKAVTFSYDDGCRQDIRLTKLFEQYHLKCTFNISSSFIGEKNGGAYLTKHEICEHMLKSGHEIAIHGKRHRAPGIIRPIEVMRDILEGRLELEQAFGRIIRGMAYPDSGICVMENGQSYGAIRDSLMSLDIAYARTLGQDTDTFRLPADWYQWMPTAHHNNPKVFDHIDSFIGMDIEEIQKNDHSGAYPRLFYLWGHSFEFDQKNNWDHMQHICEKLAGHDDIWYATNMEIYEYVTAYQALIYGTDHTMIFNPTLKTLWFEIDNVLYCIHSGEMLELSK